VIPEFIEGTIAGMAAGFFSATPENHRMDLLDRQKRLDVLVNGNLVDSALVDIAVIAGQHVGSRAVWEPDNVLQVFVTRAAPTNIGFTSIIGKYQTIKPDDNFGGMALLKEDGKCCQVQAVIGPGLIYDICIDDFQKMLSGQPIAIVSARPLVLALDGEREIVLGDTDVAEIVLNIEGPYFINIDRVMAYTQPAG
jgi:hypothetical protein